MIVFAIYEITQTLVVMSVARTFTTPVSLQPPRFDYYASVHFVLDDLSNALAVRKEPLLSKPFH